MPSSGPVNRWPFSEKEDVGQYREAEQSLQSLTDWINSTTLFLTGLTPASYTSSPRQAGKSVMPSLTLSGLRASALLIDEMERERHRLRDEHILDAFRYVIYQSPIYSPSIAQMLQTDHNHKEPEMNEIMTALEAMIRRVVTEELAAKQLTVPSYTVDGFRQGLKEYVRTEPAEWAAIVSQGALDKPWLDDAIKSEVASAMDDIPAVTGGYTFATEQDFRDRVSECVQSHGAVEDYIDDRVYSKVQDIEFKVSVR